MTKNRSVLNFDKSAK